MRLLHQTEGIIASEQDSVGHSEMEIVLIVRDVGGWKRSQSSSTASKLMMMAKYDQDVGESDEEDSKFVQSEEY